MQENEKTKEKQNKNEMSTVADVSIIMPAYNVEKFVADALESISKQSYEKWECIVVDDNSNDRTGEIIKGYCEKDSRFHYIKLIKNCGAAIARNVAIKQAKGRYLAFLDSDDIWNVNKLEKQVCFMEKNGYDFTCTSYGKIDEDGVIQSRVVCVKEKYGYSEILKNCPGNSTVIYNCQKLGKIYAEDIKRRNDFVMWLKVIKKASMAYGLNDVLTYHRGRKDSISYKKSALIKYQWMVYRKIEKLSVIKCIYLVGYKTINGLITKFQLLVRHQ